MMILHTFSGVHVYTKRSTLTFIRWFITNTIVILFRNGNKSQHTQTHTHTDGDKFIMIL